MAAPTGCLHHAGVLKDDKLSDIAKRRFIEDVKTEMTLGTKAVSAPLFPCGPVLEPVPGADQIDLEDEEKFPDFHTYILGTYEKVAKALDVDSQYTILPIVDPLALAVTLGADPPQMKFPDDFLIYGVSLQLLAIKLKLKPPVLAAKIPELISPPIPQINLPLPPPVDIEVFPHLFELLSWPLGIFDVIKNLMGQMPSLFIKALQFDLGVFCKTVFDSGLFGAPPIFDPSKSLIWAVSTKVLARKAAECVAITTIASTVGTSPIGLTGNIGRELGYVPPPADSVPLNVRSRIVEVAEEVDGESWSKDREALKDESYDYEKAQLTYTQFMFPNKISPPPDLSQPLKPHDQSEMIRNTKNAYADAKEISSCGLFVRGCFLRGGALDPEGVRYFQVPYRTATAISGLVQIANKRNASIPFSNTNIPALKKGDAILVQTPNRPGTEHVLILTKNFPGGTSAEASGIQGGSPDEGNDSKPTAIRKSKFKFFTNRGKVLAGTSLDTAKEVLKLFDAEKIVGGDS